MELQPLPKIDSPEDVRKYLGALGVHAMELLHNRLADNPDSSTKMLLDFADTALKAGDLYPKAGVGLITAGAGAVINFHFSKPPPNHVLKDVVYDHEPPSVLPPPSVELQADAILLNNDL